MKLVVLGKFRPDAPNPYFTVRHELTLTPDIEGLVESTCQIEESEHVESLLTLTEDEERKPEGTVIRTKTLIPNPEVQKWLDEGENTSIERGYADWVHLYRTRTVACRRLEVDTVEALHTWLTDHDANLIRGADEHILEPQVIVAGVSSIDWDDEEW